MARPEPMRMDLLFYLSGLLVVPAVSLPAIVAALVIAEVTTGWSLAPVFLAAGAVVAVCLACLIFVSLGRLEFRLSDPERQESDPAYLASSRFWRPILWGAVGGVVGAVCVADILAHPGPHDGLTLLLTWLAFPALAAALVTLSQYRRRRATVHWR